MNDNSGLTVSEWEEIEHMASFSPEMVGNMTIDEIHKKATKNKRKNNKNKYKSLYEEDEDLFMSGVCWYGD